MSPSFSLLLSTTRRCFIPRLKSLSYCHIRTMQTLTYKRPYGGFSTVWLARDRARNQLVSLKILASEASSSCPDIETHQALEKSSLDHPGRQHILSPSDHFTLQGPSGSHLCLVSQIAGPSISDLSYCPGRVAGYRRLRSDITRFVC